MAADTTAGMGVRVRASIAVVAMSVIASGCGDHDVSPNPIEAALASYLEAFPYERFEIVEIPNTGKFHLDDNPSLIKQAFRKGEPWSPELIEIFREYARPGTTAIDVGAHIGSLTSLGRPGRRQAQPERGPGRAARRDRPAERSPGRWRRLGAPLRAAPQSKIPAISASPDS